MKNVGIVKTHSSAQTDRGRRLWVCAFVRHCEQDALASVDEMKNEAIVGLAWAEFQPFFFSPVLAECNHLW